MLNMVSHVAHENQNHKYHFLLTRMGRIKKLDNDKGVRKAMEHVGTLTHC